MDPRLEALIAEEESRVNRLNGELKAAKKRLRKLQAANELN